MYSTVFKHCFGSIPILLRQTISRVYKTTETIIPFTFIPIIRTLMVASRPIAAISLSQTLRKYRTDQAYIRAVPESAVFSNKVLNSIAITRPNTLVSLSKLHGIGPIRCQHYGRDIVRLVNLDSKKKKVKLNGKSNGKLTATNATRKTKTGGSNITKTRAVKGSSKLDQRHKKTRTNTIANKARKPNKPAKKAFMNTGYYTTTSRGQPPQIVPRHSSPLPGSNAVTVVPKPKNDIGKEVQIKIKSKRLPRSLKTSVYVLELEDGRVYVGSSKDVPRRISQHKAGSGSAYTKIYRPTGVQLPRLGNIEGDGDAAERDETLRYMMIRGIPYVRGWKFARVDMPPEEFDEAEANIRELFDLCRRCGYKGHFCTHCRATFDRMGNPVGKGFKV